MKKLKKSLSLLLALVMVLGCMSFGAFATVVESDANATPVSTEEQLLAAVSNSGDGAADSIILSNDITMHQALLINKSVTIDGSANEYTLTFVQQDQRAIRIQTSGVTVTLKNLGVDNHEVTGSDGRGVQIDSNKTDVTLTLSNCDIKTTHSAIKLCGGTDRTTFTLDNSSAAAAWAAMEIYSNNSSFTIKDSVLRGLNDKSENEWNNYSTIVFDGDCLWNTEYDRYANDNVMSIQNSTVYASSLSSNTQKWLGIQYGAMRNTVTVDSASKLIDADNNDVTSNMLIGWYGNYNAGTWTYYQHGANKVIVQKNDENYFVAASGGATATAPAAPANDGRVFGGWLLDEGNSGIVKASEEIEFPVGNGCYSVYVSAFWPVAEVGGEYYATLQEAIDAAQDGVETEIDLIADVAEGSGLMTPDGSSAGTNKNIIIDFNDHTYTMKDPSVGSTGTESQALHFGSGTVTMKNGTFEVANNASNAKMMLQNYANLTLENIVLDATSVDGGTYGTYTGQYAVWSGKKVPIIGFNKGTVTINAGTVIKSADDALINVNLGDGMQSTNLTINGGTFDGAFIVEGTSKKTGSFVVNGGTFASNPESVLSMDDANRYNYVATGYEAVVNNDGTWMVQPAAAKVAQIGDTQYETLADAIAAITTSDETTITMIADETIEGNAGVTIAATQNVVLDLNGHTVKNAVNENKTSQIITNNGTLTVKDSTDTASDGTGTGVLMNYVADGVNPGEWWTQPKSNYVTAVINNYGTLTIESGKLLQTAKGSICYAVDNNSTNRKTTLNINGGLLTATDDGGTIVRMFCNSVSNENIVNMTGGTVCTPKGSAALWIQLPGSDATKAMKATLNVSGGTLRGSSYAFYDYSFGNSFGSTNYTLSDGTFDGDIFSYGANFKITGGTYNGEVAIKQDKASNVSVSGGMFAGDVYTYGENASTGFITGGLFATKTYEEEDKTNDCRWLSLIADGYEAVDNNDPETKDAYQWTVAEAKFVGMTDDQLATALKDAEPNKVTLLDMTGNENADEKASYAAEKKTVKDEVVITKYEVKVADKTALDNTAVVNTNNGESAAAVEANANNSLNTKKLIEKAKTEAAKTNPDVTIKDGGNNTIEVFVKASSRTESTDNKTVTITVDPYAIINSGNAIRVENSDLGADPSFTFFVTDIPQGADEGTQLNVIHKWTAYTDADDNLVAAGSKSLGVKTVERNSANQLGYWVTLEHFSELESTINDGTPTNAYVRTYNGVAGNALTLDFKIVVPNTIADPVFQVTRTVELTGTNAGTYVKTLRQVNQTEWNAETTESVYVLTQTTPGDYAANATEYVISVKIFGMYVDAPVTVALYTGTVSSENLVQIQGRAFNGHLGTVGSNDLANSVSFSILDYISYWAKNDSNYLALYNGLSEYGQSAALFRTPSNAGTKQ